MVLIILVLWQYTCTGLRTRQTDVKNGVLGLADMQQIGLFFGPPLMTGPKVFREGNTVFQGEAGG